MAAVRRLVVPIACDDAGDGAATFVAHGLVASVLFEQGSLESSTHVVLTDAESGVGLGESDNGHVAPWIGLYFAGKVDVAVAAGGASGSGALTFIIR